MVEQKHIDLVARLAVAGAISSGTSRDCELVRSWVDENAWGISPSSIMRIAAAARDSTATWAEWGDNLERLRCVSEASVNRTENIQVASLSSVGKGITWPHFTLTIEENDHEMSGGRFQIVGADVKQAVAWLRSAADKIERGERLRITSF
jgi:hypothetical protein